MAHLIGFGQAYRGAALPGNLTDSFSSNPTERCTEQSFLSMNRLRILDEFEKKIGGVYVFAGKVFVIKRRKEANRINLKALRDG